MLTEHQEYCRRYARDPMTRIRILANKARRRAVRLGVQFDPDLSDLLPPPTVCPVLGIELDYKSNPGSGPRRASPSIDRIDPRGGYIKGNRMIVSWQANRIKTDASPEEIRAVADFFSKLKEKARG